MAMLVLSWQPLFESFQPILKSTINGVWCYVAAQRSNGHCIFDSLYPPRCLMVVAPVHSSFLPIVWVSKRRR
jgi:hypothetical protein